MVLYTIFVAQLKGKEYGDIGNFIMVFKSFRIQYEMFGVQISLYIRYLVVNKYEGEKHYFVKSEQSLVSFWIIL